MSREVIFTLKGDESAVSNFVNERFVKPALAAVSAERAELMISDQMNDLRRSHESTLADLEDEKQQLADELESARNRNDLFNDKITELHEAIAKWQNCAYAFQAQLESQSKNGKPNKELKDKLFAMIDLMGTRQKVPAIKALREITGCTLQEGKIIIDKVFDNFESIPAQIIALPQSELSST